jgi:hypothetical protein
LVSPQATLTAAASRCTPAPIGVVKPLYDDRRSLSCLESEMTRTRRPRSASSSTREAADAAREALQEALDRRSR